MNYPGNITSYPMFDDIFRNLYYHPVTQEVAPEGYIWRIGADGEYELFKIGDLAATTERTPEQIVKDDPVDPPIVNTDPAVVDPQGNPSNMRPGDVIYSNLSLVIEARRRLGKMYGRRKTIITGPLGLISPAPLSYRVLASQEQAAEANKELLTHLAETEG